MSTKEVLSRNDEVIGQVLSIMKAQSVPYTAVFTAIWPSGVRLLCNSPVCTYTHSGMVGSKGFTCILLWAEKLVVSQYLSGKWERHDLAPKTFGEGVAPNLSGSSCNETHSRFVMNRRHYKVFARHWFTMDLVHLAYEGKNAMFNGSRYIYAPAEYSYRCESLSSSRYSQLSPHSDKDNANDWQISFDDFQVGSETFSLNSICAIICNQVNDIAVNEVCPTKQARGDSGKEPKLHQ
uniref:ATPase H+ transporting accessory protein 1a n=1 Tax=Cyprinus carpio TaxID=7962 RepID=A0A8C1YKD1_CYPCA